MSLSCTVSEINVVGVEQGLLPNFLHFSQGGSDTRRPTPAPSIILSPAAATARRTTPSRPGRRSITH